MTAGTSNAVAATSFDDYTAPSQARACEFFTRFDTWTDVVGVRLKAGAFGFILLARSREPVAIHGKVITARKGFIALAVNGDLRLQTSAGTRKVLKFSDRLPRANTSGKEGAINSNGSRLAVFLRPPGSSQDADSDAKIIDRLESHRLPEAIAPEPSDRSTVLPPPQRRRRSRPREAARHSRQTAPHRAPRRSMTARTPSASARWASAVSASGKCSSSVALRTRTPLTRLTYAGSGSVRGSQ